MTDDALANAHRAACSVADTLELLGDRWTMHVLHEILIGIRRFHDIQERLGISTSVLSRRLSTMESVSIIERRAYKATGQRQRHEYHLTELGRALRPVLIAMMDFGDRHLATDPSQPPLVLRHASCGAEVHATVRCEQGHIVDLHEPLEVDARATPPRD